MSDNEVVEIIYGSYSKFEIVRSPGGFLSSTKFYIHRDGKPYKGSYATLKEAVEAAKKEN